MLSSNPQDEAMLSERNEQDLFQSDNSSDEDNESDDQIDDQEDDKINPNNSFHEHQPLIKEGNKKKEIKETCMEKIKGYLGFGSLLKSQRIGNVCFIPIPRRWTFKSQIIVTQLIIAFVSLVTFFAIRYIGQAIFKNMVQEWAQDNFRILHQEQAHQVANQYCDLCNIILTNENKFINIMNDVFQQTEIMWDLNQSNQMNQALSEVSHITNKSSIYEAVTLSYSTYIQMNGSQVISNEELQKILAVNYLMKYHYYSLSATFYWIFNNGLLVQYPGINVTNITNYMNYRQRIDQDQIVSSEFIFDKYQNTYVQRIMVPIYSKHNNQQIIGRAYIEKVALNYQHLFYQFATSQLQNYTFMAANNNNKIVLQGPDESVNQGVVNLFLDLETKHLPNTTIELIDNKDEQEDVCGHVIYRIKIDDMLYSVTIVSHHFKVILVYPYTLIKQQLELMDEEFSNDNTNFNKLYLAPSIVVPILYIFGVVFFIIREIRPLEQITDFAYLSLKKSQNFDEKQLNEIKGDGLISNLTQLFKNLMIDLNEMKQSKKKQIIDYYNSQTYPSNHKERDVSTILAEIEKIQNIEVIAGKVKIPNMEE